MLYLQSPSQLKKIALCLSQIEVCYFFSPNEMPRGKWSGHKGKNRRFTNPEELEEERRREEKERAWRRARGDSSTEDEEDEAGASKEGRPPPKSSDESESDSENESEDENAKGKGVEKLIEISNPNRVQSKSKKLSTLNESIDNTKPELSRKEREELEKQQAAARYQKMHAEGKTMEARSDLARLAIIKQQREEAAKKRESEKLQKEAEAKEKAAQRDKALGKKS